ncbi:triose-phosphate isomerase [Actibacterium sp. 188UL27-1]|uniref:triose-phosphate isomerase n=1 Tax=Actibacterium sp. 188UL27-1 TaxID=2786961 RepID=UPI0019564310|nr:triose-phosphate isomerase [Actibacterium sp. 188UL27-1]MBM7070266.1 triose-phosphate isomerase [Actibacterium sp. 188UL27-1]
MRKLAAGNWKMNGLKADLDQITALATDHPAPTVDILLCLPATLLTSAHAVAGQIALGGQDCHPADSGAHTGDISAGMLAETGASAVIVGHSERRADHAETDATVAAKAKAVWAAGLTAIICVGETEAQRDAGQTLDVIAKQLSGSVPEGATGANTVIAYEPVWAIGTGRTATLDQIAEVHDFIRTKVQTRFSAAVGGGIRLLYGGSVKPLNAGDIFGVSNVDGALVGGASLKAVDFGKIIEALSSQQHH